MDEKISSESFQNWMPVKIFKMAQETNINWCYMSDKRFVEPFFEMTVAALQRDSFVRSSIRQRPFDELQKISGALSGIQPTGFIFHLSRCGSTLISQMLASLTKNIVISEAPPIDSIIRGQYREFELSRNERIKNLKFMITALGQKRFDREKYLFIKFDSWHTLDWTLISEAFPDVPKIFLYRNPIEIIVSHLRRRGMQMIPGVIENLLPDFDLQDIIQMPAEEYIARVSGRICQRALDFADHPNTLLVNYNQLPESCLSAILRHFKVNCDIEEVEKMKIAARFDAKTPQFFFASDVESKNREANDAIRLAAAKYVESFYRKLEKIRLNSENQKYL